MMIPPNTRFIVRIYLLDSMDPQVYEHVKHCWWQAGNTILTVMHYLEDGSHRYVSFPRERLGHYTIVRED